MIIIYCNFKGFHEKLDYLTFVSRRSFFVKNNFVCLSLLQFADFVCKLKPSQKAMVFFIISKKVKKQTIINNSCEKQIKIRLIC